MPRQAPEERRRNFREVALGYTLEQALAEARKRAGIAEGEPLRVVEFPEASSFLESMLDPFDARALAAARKIPYGQVRTYGWLAEAAGRPGAARAAGQAVARNPFPIIIPCHRVIAADGRLGGFGGGLEMKRKLLELEGVRLP